MIRKDLYESVHGKLKNENLKHVQQLEKYFETRRESTSQITILPNFCKDDDMSNFIGTLFPNLKETYIAPYIFIYHESRSRASRPICSRSFSDLN